MNIIGICGIAIAALTAPAQAVDIVNKDKVVRVVAVNDSDGESHVITIPAKQMFANACKSCVILTETTSVEAEGDMVVVVERGKVSIAKK